MVDAHAHWAPPSFLSALAARDESPRLDSGRVDCGYGLVYPLAAEMTDLAAQERALGAAGIAQAIVALPPPGVDRFDRDDGVAVARACNDELAVLTGERF